MFRRTPETLVSQSLVEAKRFLCLALTQCPRGSRDLSRRLSKIVTEVDTLLLSTEKEQEDPDLFSESILSERARDRRTKKVSRRSVLEE